MAFRSRDSVTICLTIHIINQQEMVYATFASLQCILVIVPQSGNKPKQAHRDKMQSLGSAFFITQVP